MRQIKLTKEKIALVDDEDYIFLSNYSWHYNDYYATTAIKNVTLNKFQTIYMHRMLMNPSKENEVDHINGNGLDNRKENLRICTLTDNSKNRKKYSNNKSGYKGVSWFKRDAKWVVYIKIDGKSRNLGYFEDKIEAARKYNDFAKRYFGEFAKTNIL